jgi:four helix bundle protein
MRPHQKLEAWSKAIELVTDVYKSSEHFPKEERYGLTGQIRRAAVSIPATSRKGRDGVHKRSLHIFCPIRRVRLVSSKRNLSLRTDSAI